MTPIDDTSLLPCRICTRQPMWYLARRTTEKTRVQHWGFIGCEHARNHTDFNHPPHGFHTSQPEMARLWNGENQPT